MDRGGEVMQMRQTAWMVVMLVACSACQREPDGGAGRLVAQTAPPLAFFGAVSSAEEMTQITAQLCAISTAHEGRWHCAECPDEQASVGEAHEVTALRQGRWALIHVSGCQHADTAVNEDSGVFVMRREGGAWTRAAYEADLSLKLCEHRAYGDQDALWCDRSYIFGDTVTRSIHVFTADDEGYVLRSAPDVHCDAREGCTTHAEGECAGLGRWSAAAEADGAIVWRWEGDVERWSGGAQALEAADGECVMLTSPGFVRAHAREARAWRQRGELMEPVTP